VVSLMGCAIGGGRWRLGRHLTSISVMGGHNLDLRQVEISDPEVTITSICFMGGDDIYLPAGVDVEVSGFTLLGGSTRHGSCTGGRPGGPRVRLRLFIVMGASMSGTCPPWRHSPR
jgi:hypothetical protein